MCFSFTRKFDKFDFMNLLKFLKLNSCSALPALEKLRSLWCKIETTSIEIKGRSCTMETSPKIWVNMSNYICIVSIFGDVYNDFQIPGLQFEIMMFSGKKWRIRLQICIYTFICTHMRLIRYIPMSSTVKFEVPASEPWPSSLHGLRLGKRLEHILSSQEFFDVSIQIHNNIHVPK